MRYSSVLGAALLYMLACAASAHAQVDSAAALSGYVIDAETGEPLPGVNVFLDGTLRGAATNGEGYFRISGIPAGAYTLVASMIGYEQQQRKVYLPEAEGQTFRLRLRPEAVMLEGVTVKDDRSLWLERLERFKTFFVGTTPNAEKCAFLNPAVLSFEVNEETETLRAYASRPLRMVNHALGYEITFYINDFTARGTRRMHTIQQSVTARFRKMEPEHAEERRRWREARRKAYYGSFRHFARTLAAGTAHRAGYRLHKTHNRRMTVSTSFRDGFPSPEVQGSAISREGRRDTWLVIELDDEDYDYLHVAYLHEPAAQKYVRMYRPDGGWINRQVSRLVFTRVRKAVVNLQTGLFIRPYSPLMQGYWGWSQRAAERLPRGYTPS